MLVPILFSLLQSPVSLQPGDIVSANLQNHTASVHRADGRFGGVLADSTSGLRGATGVAIDAAGRIHVASSQTSSVLRFTPDGRFDRVVVRDSALGAPFSLAFDRAGLLYVSAGNRHRVLRYDGQTGAPAGVAAEGHGLRTPIGLAFGDDTTLYVASGASNQVLAFHAGTGTFLRVAAAEGLRFPSDVLVDNDGTLLVSSAATREVRRFDPLTGEALGVVAALPAGAAPVGIARDCNGRLVIGDFGGSRLFRFDGSGEPVLLSREGLAGPENLVVVGCGAAIE